MFLNPSSPLSPLKITITLSLREWNSQYLEIWLKSRPTLLLARAAQIEPYTKCHNEIDAYNWTPLFIYVLQINKQMMKEIPMSFLGLGDSEVSKKKEVVKMVFKFVYDSIDFVINFRKNEYYKNLQH